MIELALYGKESSRYEYLKYLLHEKVTAAHETLSIKEINDVDTFIKDKVHSIPAIRYNGNWLFECGQDEDITQFTDEVFNKILSVKRQASKIVVPVDFSDSSENVIDYAAHLAEKCGCGIKLIHVYHPTPVQVNGQIWVNPEAERPLERRLEEYTNMLQQDFPQLAVETQIVYGFPVDELVTLSKSVDTRFIVMGTTGLSDRIKQLFGSVSQTVAQKAHCPVFAIPHQGRPKMERVLYATDDPVLDVPAINFLESLLELDNSTKVTFVHVGRGDKTKVKKEWLDQLSCVFPNLNHFDSLVIENNNVAKGIAETAESSQSDLIVVATQHRSFWNDLFHQSTTKALLRELGQRPLLIFHDRELKTLKDPVEG